MAVDAVDRRLGYTMEHAPYPFSYRALYDLEEDRLRAEIANPGLRLCRHDHRIHSLGGGQFVCFSCWSRLLTGKVLIKQS